MGRSKCAKCAFFGQFFGKNVGERRHGKMGKLCTQKAKMVYDKEEGSQPDRETIFTGRKWQKRRKQRCLPWMKYRFGGCFI